MTNFRLQVRAFATLAAAGAAAVTLAACGSTPSAPAAAADGSAADTANTAPAASAPPAGPRDSFGDGTYLVGTDVKAGTYRATSTGSCYYVTKTASGDIIANGLADKGEPVILTIAATDYTVNVRDCGAFTAADAVTAAPRDTFGDGTYLVGTDVKAGTYRATSTGSCYYVTKTASGDIIANGLADKGEPVILTIAATDYTVNVRDCGTFTPAS